MTPEFVTNIFLNAIQTAMLLAGPMLAVGLAVGVLVSIFQAATQINEMTLVFVPKMLGVAMALLLFFPWMMRIITDFATHLFTSIPMYLN